MSLQPKFLRFHQTIKIDDSDQGSTLREKRERILLRLRGNLTRSFTTFNQGSYAMHVGIVPPAGDYDIDVGVVFADPGNQLSAHEAKRLIFNAVKEHTARVEWKEPCITVYYQQSGRLLYHVDLAIYREDSYGRLHLALGKEHSAASQRHWEHQDPKGWISGFNDRYSGEDRLQMRRVVRYLKRWKDTHFSSQGYAAPPGVGFCVSAFHYFQPKRVGYAFNPGKSDYNDLGATLSLVDAMRAGFGRRLSLRMPVAPNDDVLRKMTDEQQRQFKQRLDQLSNWLREAQRSGSTSFLQRAFGPDFPA